MCGLIIGRILGLLLVCLLGHGFLVLNKRKTVLCANIKIGIKLLFLTPLKPLNYYLCYSLTLLVLRAGLFPISGFVGRLCIVKKVNCEKSELWKNIHLGKWPLVKKAHVHDGEKADFRRSITWRQEKTLPLLSNRWLFGHSFLRCGVFLRLMIIDRQLIIISTRRWWQVWLRACFHTVHLYMGKSTTIFFEQWFSVLCFVTVTINYMKNRETINYIQ